MYILLQFSAFFEEKMLTSSNLLLTVHFFQHGFEEIVRTYNPTKFYGYSLIQTDFRIGRPFMSSSSGRVEIDAGQVSLRYVKST